MMQTKTRRWHLKGEITSYAVKDATLVNSYCVVYFWKTLHGDGVIPPESQRCALLSHWVTPGTLLHRALPGLCISCCK